MSQSEAGTSKDYNNILTKRKQLLEKELACLQKRYSDKITPPKDIYHSCDINGRSFFQSSLLQNYLMQWSKSVYKLIWFDFTLWAVLYTAISLSYRFVMTEHQKAHFEDLVRSFKAWSGSIPVTFLLGFFVANVFGRWWRIYDLIPRMQFLAMEMRKTIRIKDNEVEAAKLRKEISRYLNLSWFVCCRAFCGTLKSRFKTLRAISKCQKKLKEFETEHDRNVFYKNDQTDNCTFVEKIESGENGAAPLIKIYIKKADFQQPQTSTDVPHHKHEMDDACTLVEDLELLNIDLVAKKSYCGENDSSKKVIHDEEIAAFTGQHYCEDFNALTFEDDYPTDWRLPLYWAIKLVEDKESEEVFDSGRMKDIVNIIKDWETRLVKLELAAVRNMPLVYIQVVMIAVYSIYLINVLAHQYIDPDRAEKRKLSGHFTDHYIPVIGLLQVVFMIGWFKVALVLMDPFGDDEEDFPFSHIFNDNLRVGYTMGFINKECPTRYKHDKHKSEHVQNVNEHENVSGIVNSSHSHEENLI